MTEARKVFDVRLTLPMLTALERATTLRAATLRAANVEAEQLALARRWLIKAREVAEKELEADQGGHVVLTLWLSLLWVMEIYDELENLGSLFHTFGGFDVFKATRQELIRGFENA